MKVQAHISWDEVLQGQGFTFLRESETWVKIITREGGDIFLYATTYRISGRLTISARYDGSEIVSLTLGDRPAYGATPWRSHASVGFLRAVHDALAALLTIEASVPQPERHVFLRM